MNKNYYDLLQVNRNASPEIIEKAYKILAKKYHPDLQTEENKNQSEEILKEINEAYEVLSNPQKKEIYDASLIKEEKKYEENNFTDPQTISMQELNKKKQEELLRQQQLAYQEQQRQELLRREQELAYQEQLQQAKQKAYYDAYIQDLKNRGYKIRYRKSLKDYITSIFSILITLFILFLLWQIPFIQNFILDFFKDNIILKSLLKN